MFNLGHLETAKQNFKKIGRSRTEKPKLEKGLFGSMHTTTVLLVGHKKGYLNHSDHHLAISQS